MNKKYESHFIEYRRYAKIWIKPIRIIYIVPKVKFRFNSNILMNIAKSKEVNVLNAFYSFIIVSNFDELKMNEKSKK